MIEAWIDSNRFKPGYTVQIGGGLFDLGTRTLAGAVKLAKNDRRVKTIHLPMVQS